MHIVYIQDKNKFTKATAWWNCQATTRNIYYGGVTDEKYTVGAIERHNNPEPDLLERTQRVVIQIIYDIIRGNQMKPA